MIYVFIALIAIAPTPHFESGRGDWYVSNIQMHGKGHTTMRRKFNDNIKCRCVSMDRPAKCKIIVKDYIMSVRTCETFAGGVCVNSIDTDYQITCLGEGVEND